MHPSDATDKNTRIRLSVCMATYGRAGFIRQTLESILCQVTDGVEVVVVDGASPDDTPAVVGALVASHPCLVYRRESSNAGVDHDFDKAVGYARGEHCWLVSDDDLMMPGAIARVLAEIADDPAAVIVNAQILDKSLSRVLKARQLEMEADRAFAPAEQEQFFRCAASYLSFIGAVVIRRAAWLARERERYYGSLFIHVGVLFQSPLPGPVKVLAAPLVQIRYGNALWSARGFEIWTRKWPDLVWSFDQFAPDSRRQISPRFPARRLVTLLWYRGIGAFAVPQWTEMAATAGRQDRFFHPLAGVVARSPAAWVNACLALACCVVRNADASMKLYDLARAACAPALTRWLARTLGPGPGNTPMGRGNLP